ncbi:hypothetical protein Lser_V15G11439 [Lactuca serriola]
MESEEESGCSRIKNNKPLRLDWEELLPSSSGDDDRPPELLVRSKKKFKGGGSGTDAQENQMEDLELQTKSLNEITESITRFKKNLVTLAKKLPDNGEKLKGTLQRYEDELERRNKLKSEKVDFRCDETIQLSDHSDEGDSSGKKKGDQKSSYSSKFAKLFNKKIVEGSRTVNAFDSDLSIMNHCQGRKGKQNSQPLGKGKSKKALPSPRTPVVDNEKQIFSNDDKKYSDSTSSPDPPATSRNLRPRHKRTYHLLDEEPQFHSKIQYADLGICEKDVTVYYPSRDDPGSVEVNYADMACLAPEACLSSTIMNFYIRYLQQPTSSSESSTCHYHFFNTYFYNKLEKLSYKEDSFLKFRKWWKGVNIFEKAYILLPIHDNAHWSLVIICFPTKEDELGPILLHLDSLGLHNSKSLFVNIKRFLKEEWSYLRKSEVLEVPIPDEIWENLDTKMDHRRVTVPQQMNEYDCGLFVLLYMERFIKEAPRRLKKKHLTMFGRQWFQPEEASDLRVKVHNLLVEEFKNVKEKKES